MNKGKRKQTQQTKTAAIFRENKKEKTYKRHEIKERKNKHERKEQKKNETKCNET